MFDIKNYKSVILVIIELYSIGNSLVQSPQRRAWIHLTQQPNKLSDFLAHNKINDQRYQTFARADMNRTLTSSELVVFTLDNAH